MDLPTNFESAAKPFFEDLQVESKSSDLKGWHLAFCVSGGIAAIEAPRTIRELRRRGATVQVWATEKAFNFIGRTSLEWASGGKVLTEPDGLAQHVATGIRGIIVYPATAQMIGLLNQGLCADGMSTFLQSGLGLQLPMVIFPAMHDSLNTSPAITENITQLTRFKNVRVLQGTQAEGKQKVPSPEVGALLAAHALNALELERLGRAVGQAYVTGGGTRSAWDPVRCLTNISTGRLSRALCESLYARGIAVTFMKAQTNFEMNSLPHLKVHDCADFSTMQSHLSALNLGQNDGFFHLAAVSDFLIAQQSDEKISSAAKTNSLLLNKAPKLLGTPQNLQQCAFRFAGKLTTGTKVEGLKIAHDFLLQSGYTACLWNHANALMGAENTHEGTILKTIHGRPLKSGEKLQEVNLIGKKLIAEKIADMYLEALNINNSRD